MAPLPNLLGLPAAAIHRLLEPVVDTRFRAAQVSHWLLEREATAFGDMTNLPLTLRRDLAARFSLAEPTVVTTAESADGSCKYLFRLGDGALVEAVAMPAGPKVTMCLSTQAGCAVGCTFCVTGALGAGRNLSADEIVGQYRCMRRALPADTERVNLVFMGMGEPLLNRRHLGSALAALAARVSPKRITVSTAGIIPGIRWLAGLERRPKLAVSLNAPDQERREQVMPISRRYPLAELIEELRRFPLERGRRITFEYVLIRGFNDAAADAAALVRLIRGIPAKINVIPLNEDATHFPSLRQPEPANVDRFAAALHAHDLTATVRWSKGRDVAAACGQLKGQVLTASDH